MFIKLMLFLLMLGSFVQAKEYKVVFDCSAKDARFVMGRMILIERTINMIKEQGDSALVALTLHGGCVAMVSRNYDEIVDDADMDYIQKAQESISRLKKEKNVEVIVCAMSLNANTIDEDDVLPFVKITPNSFIDTIGYQNDGYALMSFK